MRGDNWDWVQRFAKWFIIIVFIAACVCTGMAMVAAYNALHQLGLL